MRQFAPCPLLASTRVNVSIKAHLQSTAQRWESIAPGSRSGEPSNTGSGSSPILKSASGYPRSRPLAFSRKSRLWSAAVDSIQARIGLIPRLLPIVLEIQRNVGIGIVMSGRYVREKIPAPKKAVAAADVEVPVQFVPGVDIALRADMPAVVHFVGHNGA